MGPLILISGSERSRVNYENTILAAGGRPRSCYCPVYDPRCAALVLAGGGDVAPEHYGRTNCGSVGIDPRRDAAEFTLIEAFLAAGKPILGICRGHQILNIALGGTLIQDLGPEQNLFHRTRSDGSDGVHAVQAAEDSVLYRLYGPVFCVNSAHHQAAEKPGRGLRVTARSESGVIEALEHESLPLLSVQFHPERMSGTLRRSDTVESAPIFAHFLSLCAKGEGRD